MTKCFACGRDMNDASGCNPDRTITINDTEYSPVPRGDKLMYQHDVVLDPRERCHDCGAKMGEYHHPGCDMEKCPECGEQYFICDCVTDEKIEIWGPVK